MNEHPDELLAEYGDDALGPEDRARVEAHVSGCARCTEELSLAGEARTALGTLPVLEAPDGIGFAARSEARRGSPRPRLLKAVAGIAAAAVLIGGVTFAALSGGDDAAESPGEGDAAAEAPASEETQERAPEPAAGFSADAAVLYPRFERSGERYRAGDLADVGGRLREEALGALEQGMPPTAADFYAGFDVTTLPRPTAQALACVTDAFTPDRSVVPFVIEQARFEQEPAYLASFLQGPAPDQPYDRIVLIVAGRDDCVLRTLASQRL